VTFYGGVEAGGTKFACVIGTGPHDIIAEASFPTTTPEQTIGRVVDFFLSHAREHPVAAVGIGSFGPVDLDRRSPTFGFITTTPKPGWEHVDVCGPIRAALPVPIAFDTDVNAAAFGEHHWVADNRALDPLLYATVGTGIGVGAIVHGEPLHGLVHPEAGHMYLPHNRTRDPFDGACPFHGDCWEGLASGVSLEKRWGRRGDALAPDHPAWELEAHYLGLGITNLIYCLSPRRVVLGGGVMQLPGLLERVRGEVQNSMHGYPPSESLAREIERLIVPPRLGSRSGVFGALALAARL
jgi:fructokinase